MGLINRVFSAVVNLNQWFVYGKSWLALPLTIVALSSQFSILLFFLGISNIYVLVSITVFSILASLGFGYVLFKQRGESIDKTMMTWRNTMVFMAELISWETMIIHAQETNMPFPEELRSYGVEDWGDCRKLFKWILDKGEAAKANEVIQNYFKHNKSTTHQ